MLRGHNNVGFSPEYFDVIKAEIIDWKRVSRKSFSQQMSTATKLGLLVLKVFTSLRPYHKTSLA